MDGYFAATSFEVEAERRREVLDAEMRNGRHRALAVGTSARASARPMAPSTVRRLGIVEELLARVSLKA